jgi:hypothetical protein
MSDEKGKKAGGISKFKQQYGQIGSSKRLDGEKSETQDTQTPKSPNFQNAETLNTQSVENSNIQQSNISDVQSAEVSDVQSVKPPAIQTSEMAKGQNMNSLAVQDAKGTHKGRTQKTIYLPPRLARRLDRRALDEDRERSEIVADALELYFKSVPLVQKIEDQE